MIRLGLCCVFFEQPIKFRNLTILNLERSLNKGKERLNHLSELVLLNVNSLIQAELWCIENGIGCFRIHSDLFPIYTHPKYGYNLTDLPDYQEIKKCLDKSKKLAKQNDLRLTLHPDQYVVLNSLKPEVVKNSLKELEYQGYLADLAGADVVNIHAGGVYGDKKEALVRLGKNILDLSVSVRRKLTLENDDTSFSVEDLLPFCLKHHIPLVYDIHHHRCLKDNMDIETATREVIKTWNREPLFHISSPNQGWNGLDPKPHHDMIDIEDFPIEWLRCKSLTIEVEAKAKEIAVLALKKQLALKED